MKATILVSALAVAGTGAAVAGGVALNGSAAPAISAAPAPRPSAVTTDTERTPVVSRDLMRSPVVEKAVKKVAARKVSARKVLAGPASPSESASTAVIEAKSAVLAAVGDDASAITGSEDLSTQDPQSIASALLSSYGWDGSQFGCLVNLWDRESNWSVTAANPSGAYGIPQALPGSKMASAGADWRYDAETQIRWGLGYIQDRYGSPCGAWSHSESHGWY